MARKNKIETVGGSVEQVASKPTTRVARKKQVPLPEVQEALSAVEAAKAYAKEVARSSKLTSRIVHAITKSGADPFKTLSRVAMSFDLEVRGVAVMPFLSSEAQALRVAQQPYTDTREAAQGVAEHAVAKDCAGPEMDLRVALMSALGKERSTQ